MLPSAVFYAFIMFVVVLILGYGYTNKSSLKAANFKHFELFKAIFPLKSFIRAFKALYLFRLLKSS